MRSKQSVRFDKLRNFLKQCYRSLRKLRLRNRDFTIISSNCIAGIIYHDLGLPFLTPTINLFFRDDDYFRFLANLDDYLRCEPEEIHEPGISYPIGLLRRGGESVKVYFMHYASFAEAAAKWKERAARVNPQNLYVIFEYPAVDAAPWEQEAVKCKFDAVPYSRKVMLTKKHSPLSGGQIRRLRFYEKDYYPGKFIAPNKRIPFKRYLDAFDYISFLNRKG